MIKKADHFCSALKNLGRNIGIKLLYLSLRRMVEPQKKGKLFSSTFYGVWWSRWGTIPYIR